MNLSDIFGDDTSDLKRMFSEAEEAADFDPLPRGEYLALITDGELIKSKTNETPGYQLTFTVHDGEFKGRRFWHTSWFTAKAVSLSKRDLKKIGVTDLAQLDQPIPKGILCKCKLALRKDDDASEYNRVVRFEVVDRIDPPVDEFDGEGQQ